jgi:GT2 family glycosyltransferase
MYSAKNDTSYLGTDDIQIKDPLIAVVIVHWKNADDTAECLESLSKINYPQLTVILVNNNSEDFDEARFRLAYSRIESIYSKENLGLTGGNNLGIEKALKDGADFILFLNPDTIVRPNLIHSLLTCFKEPDIAIVGPVITYYDHPQKIWFAGGNYNRFLSYTRHPYMGMDINHRGVTRYVDWINTCAMLVKREVFEKIGVFSEDFFIFFDEAEFCLRAAKVNYKCLLVEEPLVLHKISATMGKRGTNDFTPNKAYYFGRNSFIFIKKRAEGIWKITSIFSQFFIIFPYWVIQCLKAKNTSVIRDYMIGMFDGVIGKTGKRH